MTNLQWFKEADNLVPKPSALTYDWLTKPYILSRALKRICKTLDVRVISQQFETADEDEYAFLNLDSNQQPMVRQVFLLGDTIPLTFGRVVIPLKTYEAHFSQFASLGSNLIGETLLYNNPDVSRGPFEFVQVTPSHPLATSIYEMLPQSIPRISLWGRRSIFSIHSFPLLVMELLLPTLPEYKD